MASPPSPSKHTPSRPPQRITGNPSSEVGEGSSNNDRARDGLWRGHSDSDVLARGLGPYSSMLGMDAEGDDGQTWMDFLREGSSDGREDGDRQTQLDARRIAVMAVDRKRRFMVHEDELMRRRSISGTIAGPPPIERSQRSMHPPPRTRTNNGLGSSSSNVMDPSSPERPLPRRPSIGSIRNRISGDFVLPRWQPDLEVSKCPICGTQFSFWYRKHHCRKCGRVVCASCSPHRITIPRQFIVHPPMDASSGFVTGGTAHIEVVDLTENADEDLTAYPNTGQIQGDQQSPRRNRRVDSALGGGQEVRLCNPCVPDPNPLPPPNYTSTTSNARSLPPVPGSNRPLPSPPRIGSNLSQPRASPVPPIPSNIQDLVGDSSSVERWNPVASTAVQGPEESVEAFLRRRRRREFSVSDSKHLQLYYHTNYF